MTGTGVYRSTDSGDSWTFAGLAYTEISALAFEPSTGILYAATRYEGLQVSGDGGDTWQSSTPLLATAVFTDMITDNREARSIFTATNTGVYSFIESTAPMVIVQSRTTQTGIVNPTLSNQVLPAAAVTLLFSANPFPSANSSNPVILELRLPAGATLGQTMATGRLEDLTEQPRGRTILPLAVSEYTYDPASSTNIPWTSAAATNGIYDQAVQLFRCVGGEDRIWLRLNQSTNSWDPSGPERILGVTIGAGAGVWPPTAGSNWGAEGKYRQENTQFFGDIRGFDFSAQDGRLPLTLRAFYQKTGVETGTIFTPGMIDLFRLDLDWPDTYAPASLLGAVMTDWTSADLDGDGREDLVSVDGGLKRLYWSLGRPAGPSPRRSGGPWPATRR